MDELLNQPKVKKEFKKLTPEMREWFKKLLVKQGIYAQYVKERKGK